MRRFTVLLLCLACAPAFAGPLIEALKTSLIPAVKDTILTLLWSLTQLGIAVWAARLVYNRFAPKDFPRFDWKFNETHDPGPMYSENEFAARQRAAARLEARNDIYQDLRDIEDYYPPLDDH